ncbi:MAG2810 family protein [Mycoplasmopsis adleri]|uniref:MAG2810 family protein n=1 Tax=Mycoplasmopsis adleri TaxID=51362 RepID=UPI003872A9C2
MGKNIISYNVINFYKNIHNFRDLSTYNLTLGKYEMYEASTVNQFFKMQNLLYVDNSWVDTTDLDKKTLRSLYRMNASTYKNKIELDERKLRFGIATRIGNINKDFNITLFDNNDCFTAPELKLITLDKEYESIVLNAIDNQLLRNWLKDENNLKYIKDLRNQITSLKINNPVAKRRSNKSLVKNLSLVLRNQEAFIWFDTNCELLDVAYITKTLNPKNIIDAITNKLLDDFYLIYLVIQLLAPFGLDLTLKISEKEVNEANEVDVRPNDDFANVSEPVSPTATTSVK